MVFNKPLFITDRRRKIVKQQLRLLLQYNIIELVFQRRIYPPRVKRMRYGKPTPVRRILCTADWKYLKEFNKVFDWKRPSRGQGRSEKWYRDRNLVIVWDLIIKNYRIISLDDYRIMDSFPIETEHDKNSFIAKYQEMFKRRGKNFLERKLNQ